MKQSNRKPGFFRQGVLILTPVLVLALMGAYGLRKEQRLALHEAEGRAQELAEGAAQRIWESLHNSASAASNRIDFDQAGNLLFPKPYDHAPIPRPLDEQRLNDKQRRLWKAAQQLTIAHDTASRNSETNVLIAPLVDFLRTEPPAEFAAIAHFKLGLSLKRQGRASEAQSEFATITNRHASATTESGLLLDLLARAQIQRPSDFARYALDHPCSITRQLLSASGGTEAVAIWNRQEQLRGLAAAASRYFITNSKSSSTKSTPDLFWVSARDDEKNENIDWLLVRSNTTNGFALMGNSEPSREMLSSLDALSRPDWLGLAVSLAGREIGSHAEGNGQKPEILGSASRGNQGSLVVSALLANRDLLFAEQRRRTLWFGSVIAVAGTASLIGFLSGYRAFHKQHRLAEMKSNFVSSVSHELRAPIASIRLLAEGLERGKIGEPAKQQEYFRFIVQECRRLSAMIENVLDFARIEQGRKQYEFEPVDVVAMAEQTVKLMEPYATDHGVQLVPRFKSNGAPAELIAEIDGQAVQQALVNLIDNAVKHSPSGESVVVTLAMSANGEASADGAGNGNGASHFCLSVDDHGPGIPVAEHEKIFERFYRLGSELRRETPGVGIGLSIVKHVMEAHRGRVLVQSEPGKGSRFTIELPLNQNKQKDHP